MLFFKVGSWCGVKYKNFDFTGYSPHVKEVGLRAAKALIIQVRKTFRRIHELLLTQKWQRELVSPINHYWRKAASWSFVLIDHIKF